MSNTNTLLVDSGACVSVINDALKLHNVKSRGNEILTSINGTTVVTKSGVAKVDLVDAEGKHFEFHFEANCAPGADLPGAGILSCTGYPISLNDSGGSIKLPDEDGKYHDVNVRRRHDGLPVIDISPEKPMYWIPQLVHDTLGHVSSNTLLTAFNNGWITSDKPLDELQAKLNNAADNCVTCKIGHTRQTNHG